MDNAMSTNEAELEELRRRARQEAAVAWKGVETAAYVFGYSRKQYCLNWIISVYGSDLGLDASEI